MSETTETGAAGIRFTFQPACGLVCDLAVTDDGALIAPLHRAPWVDEPLPPTALPPTAFPPDAPPHQARLQGDFLCAPMGAGPDGLHGLAANGQWQVMPSPRGTLRAVLQGAVQGATIVKEVQLQDGHPFLYQRHLFIGGTGRLPVASHAMIAVPNGARLSFSPKRWFETLPAPLETDPARGRSALAYPRRNEDPGEFPAADGSTINLLRYPWAPAHEDFVSAVEDPASPLGWAAVVRPAEGDLILSLKSPRILPMTMLWHSNGGRDYAPWNGRHRGCLGVEEGAALPNLGLSARETPDPLAAAGQPGLLTLDPRGNAELRHILGAIRWPSGQSVAAVRVQDDGLSITGDWGAERHLPFRADWLAPPAACATPTPTPTAKRPLDWDL